MKCVYEKSVGKSGEFKWVRAEGRMGTKKVPCSAEGCDQRRIHHERPDEPRGTQWCTVKANHSGPAFCSLSCMLYHKGCIEEKGNEEKGNEEIY